MSKEKKTFIFKHLSQELKFRGSSSYRPKTHKKFEEHLLPINELDQQEQEKIDLQNSLISSENSNDNEKIILNISQEAIDPSLILNDESVKFNLTSEKNINEHIDKQSLNSISVQNLLEKQEQQSSKNITLPSSIKSRKPYYPKTIDKLEEDILINEKYNSNHQLNSKPENIYSPPPVVKDENTNNIVRTTFSSFNTHKMKKGLDNKTSSFQKNKQPLKSENVLEEEEKGIFRTSSFNKFKNKSKLKKQAQNTNENEISRTSELKNTKFNNVQKNFNNGRKVFVYNEEKLYNYGINRLSEQDYGRHELFKKMSKLQEDEAIINKVLDKLENQKFLNDNNRIRSFLLSYSNSESVNKTKQRLIQKGFDKKNIESVLEEMENSGIYKSIQDTETEDDKAIKLLVRKYRIYEADKNDKMSRFLISKGFSFDIVSKALKTFSNGDFDSFDPY